MAVAKEPRNRCTVRVRHNMTPRFGQRPAPLDPFDLDRRTLQLLEGELSRRLEQVETYGGRCACKNAEATAFLAKLRDLIQRTGG